MSAFHPLQTLRCRLSTAKGMSVIRLAGSGLFILGAGVGHSRHYTIMCGIFMIACLLVLIDLKRQQSQVS